jgi:hypothetical protein
MAKAKIAFLLEVVRSSIFIVTSHSEISKKVEFATVLLGERPHGYFGTGGQEHACPGELSRLTAPVSRP